MTAPERIWIDRGPKGRWMHRHEKVSDSKHEYICADLCITRADHDRMIADAVAKERERCAKIADAHEYAAKCRANDADDETQSDWEGGVIFGTEISSRIIAAAIRDGK